MLATNNHSKWLLLRIQAKARLLLLLLVVQWLRLWASTAWGVGEWVPSLAGEVRYCMLPVAAKKVKKPKN